MAKTHRLTKSDGGRHLRKTRVSKPKKVMERRAYSLRETADMLGISMDAIRRLVKIEKLKTVRLVPRGNHLVTKVEIDRILAGGNCK